MPSGLLRLERKLLTELCYTVVLLLSSVSSLFAVSMFALGNLTVLQVLIFLFCGLESQTNKFLKTLSKFQVIRLTSFTKYMSTLTYDFLFAS